MLYVPAIPTHLKNIYFEYVAQTFATALRYDAVTNPAGLQWLKVIYPFAERHQGVLKGYVRDREYVPIQPDDSFRAMCYFLPEDPLTRVAADSWQFFFDVVFFVNLDAIYKTLAPQGRYHAILMQEAIAVIEALVWGFSKELTEARILNMRDIFAEIDSVDAKYLLHPYAAFRLRYDIHIAATCVNPVSVAIETCFTPPI